MTHAGWMRWRPRSRAVAAGLVFAAAAVLSALTLLAVQWVATPRAHSGGDGTGFVRLHRPARDVSLPTLRGRGTIDLAGLAGTPIVMNFWSSTCDPCKKETPALVLAARALGAKVAFVGIDTADLRRQGV